MRTSLSTALWRYSRLGAAVAVAASLAALACYRLWGASSLRHVVFAGGGGAGYGGDGGKATEAGLDGPTGLALDAQGNLYVADSDNHAIRCIDRHGIISTIAGTGKEGYGGDKGPANKASLAGPEGVWASRSGPAIVYVADTLNNCIRKIDEHGTISTVAGNGQSDFGGDGGPAVNARLAYPADVALDQAGNVYIADTGNNRIRRVDPTGVISTIAGNGKEDSAGDGGPAVQAALQAPRGLAIAPSGELYVSTDTRVRCIDTSRRIRTVIGGGDEVDIDGIIATSARLGTLGKIALDNEGTVFVVDHDKRRFLKSSSKRVHVVFEDHGGGYYPPQRGAGSGVTLVFPSGIVIDAKRGIFISDERACRVLLFYTER